MVASQISTGDNFPQVKIVQVREENIVEEPVQSISNQQQSDNPK